ncbi:hypothetical protein PENTCL1PPCAC_25943, partial [Pristionchus entomophagus]
EKSTQKISGRHHIRPLSIFHRKATRQYCGDQFVERGLHKEIPSVIRFLKDREWMWEKIEESEDFKEAQPVLAMFNKDSKKNMDTDSFFIEDQPHIFYHPEKFDVEETLKGNGNPCGHPVSRTLPKIVVKEDVLRETIHPSEIYELEWLLKRMMEKQKIDLPEGLTRPSSLLKTFDV